MNSAELEQLEKLADAREKIANINRTQKNFTFLSLLVMFIGLVLSVISFVGGAIIVATMTLVLILGDKYFEKERIAYALRYQDADFAIRALKEQDEGKD